MKLYLISLGEHIAGKKRLYFGGQEISECF